MEELDEEGTGEYNRKGEVDRSKLLMNSSIVETNTIGKKKKVLFKAKNFKSKDTGSSSDIFNKLQRMTVKPIVGKGDDPTKGPPLNRA